MTGLADLYAQTRLAAGEVGVKTKAGHFTTGIWDSVVTQMVARVQRDGGAAVPQNLPVLVSVCQRLSPSGLLGAGRVPALFKDRPGSMKLVEFGTGVERILSVLAEAEKKTLLSSCFSGVEELLVTILPLYGVEFSSNNSNQMSTDQVGISLNSKTHSRCPGHA